MFINFTTVFFLNKRNPKIYRSPVIIFGLIFGLVFLGGVPEMGVCEISELKIATWNIENFGWDGIYKREPNEMQAIAKILYKYDLIAITELMKKEMLKPTLKLLSEMGREYGCLVSKQVGEERKEYYAFLYYKGLVRVVSKGEDGKKGGHLYPDPDPIEGGDGIFDRDPYWATFRAGKFDFSVIVVHLSYENLKKRLAEIAELARVYRHVQRANGENEDDVLIVGDFNLEPSAKINDVDKEANAEEGVGAFDSLLENRKFSTMIALFNEKNDRSNIGDKELYDNIFFERKILKEYLYSGVDKFDEKDLGVNGVSAKGISNHRPVWAVFRIDVDNDASNADAEHDCEEMDDKNDEGGAASAGGQSSEEETDTELEQSTDEAVYVTNTGKKYHRGSCSSLRESQIPISLAEAKKKYDPCNRCKPPL